MDKNAELEAKILGDDLAASTIDRVVDGVDLNFLSRQVTSPVNHGLSVSYGNSWDSGRKGKIGVIAAASYKNSYTNLPQVAEKRWFLSDINAGELENIGDYDAHVSTSNPIVNGLAGLAYKFNGLNSLNLNVIYNHNTSKETQYVFGEKPENIIRPTFFEGRANLFEEREMINYQVSGDHVIPALNRTKIEWSGSYVNARMDQPNLRFFSNQYNAESGNFSIPLSNVEDPLLFWRDLSDQVINGKVDIEIPLNLKFLKSSKIKFGALHSAKDRDFNEYRYLVYSPPSGQRFNGDFEAFVGEGATGVLAVEENGDKNKYTIGNYLINGTRPDNSYNGNEDISAAYLMANVQIIEKLKIVAGARIESTNISVKSKNELRADSLRIGEIKSNDLLPSANIIYSIKDNMNLRGSYNKTLARPNLREIAPFVAFDPLTGDFIIGNTQLKKTNITNIDLRWELFLQPGEIISAGVFYKHFTNPIVEQYLNSSNPERQFANVDEGEIYGLELEFRKNLGFITPLLSNLKFGSNVAFIQSFTNVNDQTGLEPKERPFTGQAPFLANLNLTYTEPTSDLAANLAYNYIGRRLSNIARNGTPDVYNAALNTLDFSISKKVGRASIALNAKNLLDAKFERSSTFKGQTFVYQSFRKGISFGLSLRVDL
jgi:TonB-dependent receptor